MELQLDLERTADHSKAAVGEAIADFQKEMCDILLVLGTSAIADRRDVPVAIESAGGKVLQLGMPVDPGNLTLLARLDDMWIVGLPDLRARLALMDPIGSLQRLVAGLEVGAKRYSFNECRRFVKRDPKPAQCRARKQVLRRRTIIKKLQKLPRSSFRPVNLAEWGHKTNYWPILMAYR